MDTQLGAGGQRPRVMISPYWCKPSPCGLSCDPPAPRTPSKSPPNTRGVSVPFSMSSRLPREALGSGTSEWPSATQRIGVAFRATRCFAGHWKRAPMTLKLAREVLHMVRARLVVWIS